MTEVKPQIDLPDYVKNPRLMKARVYIGLPTYDGRVHQSAIALKKTCSQVVGRAPTLHIESSSILTRTFNALYAAALNARADGYTHFLMIHEDVHPLVPGWLDKMLGIMDMVGADVLSAVSPIKNVLGLTSTALELPGDVPNLVKIQRLTMREIMKEPETFTHPNILVNTGLMLIDLSASWVEDVWFEFSDSIVKGQDGKFVAAGCSEDWNFSRMVRAKGGKLWATRAIPLVHRGGGEFRNDQAWGTLLTDK
jgi:hypothetical protein